MKKYTLLASTVLLLVSCGPENHLPVKERDSIGVADSFLKIALSDTVPEKDNIPVNYTSNISGPDSLDRDYARFWLTFDELFNKAQQLQCSQNFVVDSGINEFRLENPAAIHNLLGTKLPLVDGSGEHPYFECVNHDKSQILRLVFHEGGTYDYFDEMELRYCTDTITRKVLHAENFKSYSGISLGMSRREIISLTGNCFASTGKAGNDSLMYTRTKDDLDFRYFIFKNNQLIYYRIGQIYP